MALGPGTGQSIGLFGWVLSEDVPVPPLLDLVLVVEDLLNGQDVEYTITGGVAGVENVCVAINAAGETIEVGSIVGNGSAVFALSAGPFWGYARASDVNGYGVSNLFPFGVTDGSGCDVRSDFGDEFLALEEETLLPEFGETVTVRRGISAFTATAILAPVVTRYDDREGIDVAVGDSAWLIRVGDYDFGAGCVEPRRFDRIITALGAEYEVVDPGDIDRERIMRTVPTRRSEHK